MAALPQLEPEKIEKIAPGVDPMVTSRLIGLVNSDAKALPHYFFVNPDLSLYAKALSTDVATVFTSFKFLAGYFGEIVCYRLILMQDDLFYPLQEEDLDELATENTLHHPDDPTIVFSNAKDLVRHAFVLKAMNR
jgi:hypothetical protein